MLLNATTKLLPHGLLLEIQATRALAMEAAVQLGLDKTFNICMPCNGRINMSFSQKLFWFFSFSLTFSLSFHFMAEEATS
jgi:hypothetical protein